MIPCPRDIELPPPTMAALLALERSIKDAGGASCVVSHEALLVIYKAGFKAGWLANNAAQEATSA